MCEKYNIELLGTLPLEPKIADTCERGKSISKEHPDALSTKILASVCDSRQISSRD